MARQYNKKTLEQRANDLERKAALLRERERKQRTSILIDLGAGCVDVFKRSSHKVRQDFFDCLVFGLSGKLLERRKKSVEWLRSQCEQQTPQNENQGQNEGNQESVEKSSYSLSRPA